MEDYFFIAEIISIYDDNGFVKIKSFSDFPERFFSLDKVYINIFGDYREFTVENVEQLGKYFLLKFKNFDSEEDVEFLVGSSIFVNQKNSVSLEDDTFFIHDLVGCKVFYNKKFFGNVIDVLSLNSNDVYVLDDNGFERLVPAISEYIKTISTKNKRIELKVDFDKFSDNEN